MPSMKPVAECRSCQLCAKGYGVGFAGAARYRCLRTGEDVTADDGCTMGEPGTPSTLCDHTEAMVDGYAAVWGWRSCEQVKQLTYKRHPS